MQFLIFCNLSIANSVLKIGEHAFYRNELEILTIPSSIETIESWAFGENDFTKITIYGLSTRFDDRWIYLGFPRELE